MAKRGNHQGFATARVNSHVESRSIIADALAGAEEDAEPSLPPGCVNVDGTCCACHGCVCPPHAEFAQDFNAKQGKTLRNILGE